MAAKIKKGDNVVVLTGRDKGKAGTVAQVLPKEKMYSYINIPSGLLLS